MQDGTDATSMQKKKENKTKQNKTQKPKTDSFNTSNATYMNTSSLKNSPHFLVTQRLKKLYKYNYMFLQISKTRMSGFAKNVKFGL